MRGSAPQSQPWTSYGGISNTGPVTLIGQAQRQIQNAMGAFGPLGQLAAPYVAEWLVGKDFNRTGTLNNPLSGLLAPSGGTYASAYQHMNHQQVLASLQNDRDTMAKKLRKDFYTNYYSMTMGQPAKSEAVQNQVEAAMKNMLSLPSALQFIFDPANNERIMQGIKNTQAGYLYWEDRKAPSWNFDLDQRKKDAQTIGNAVRDMAAQANKIQLGGSTGGWKGSYGGFTGAEVSELTSILANTSNIFSTPGTDIDGAVKKLKEKVKGLTQALAPLKDIFGTDIKAMVDMIQSTTGQNINQLPTSMVSSIARSTVDMARYSGATVTQMAQAGQRIFMQSAQMGGTSFSRIGANLTGGIYSALVAQGNTPAGVHAAQYSGFAQRTLASAQASAGVDWTAMAYGLWAEDPRNKDKSIDDFMAQVRQNRGNGTLMDAVIATAGVKNQQGLLRGRGTVGYRTSLQSGRLAQLGMEGQYYTQLGDAIAAMKQQNPEFSASQWDKLGTFMANDANAAWVKQLAANGNNADFVNDFANKVGVNSRLVNTFLSSANMQSYMASWGTSMQATAYAKGQQEIRKATEDLDAAGTGGLLAFWKAASAVDLTKNGVTLKNKATIGKEAVLAQGRAVLGATDINDMQQKLSTVKGVFGEESATYLALAEGQFSKDKEYLARLKSIAGNKYKNNDDGEKQRAVDIGYLRARKQGYLGANMELTDKAAKKVRDEALAQIAHKDFKTDEDKKKYLDKQMAKALRLQNLSKMSAVELGFTGDNAKDKKEALRKLVNEGRNINNLTKADAKSRGFSSVRELKQAYQAAGTNYNNQVDVNRMLVTALSMLIKWLQEHPNKGDGK